jgi:superfamily I DNA/RNA helicase/RecB family exonuclease
VQYRLVGRSQRREEPVPALDEAQRRVVNHRDGPLLVLAGPGTGKTTTLVESVVQRVRSGVPVDSILMLTFSRRAAQELRDRVTARLGGTVREPIARTFHSYAFGVLRLAAATSGLPVPRLLAGPEQDVIVRELILGDLERGVTRWPAELRPALPTHAFAAELRDLLLRAVERGLDGPALATLGRAHRLPAWVAAGEFLQEYLDVTSLARPGAWDPAELIRTATDTLLAEPDLLGQQRARWRRIFVDEYQDTDPAQAELLQLLAQGAAELIIVGDPDQSIYAFRGADSAAMADAADRFQRGKAPVPTVALSTSRRAGAHLLAASRRIADRLPGPARQRALVPAAGSPPGSVEVHLLRSAAEEAAYVAAVLRRAHIHDGVPWARMAVLMRSTGPRLPVLRRALLAVGVPYRVATQDMPLGDEPAVATLLLALRCAAQPGALSDEAAEQLLLGPIGRVDPLGLRRLRRELGQLAAAAGQPDHPSLLASAVEDRVGAAALPGPIRRSVERLGRVLAAARAALQARASTEDVLWALWDATGLAGRWEAASVAGGSAGAAADRDLDAVMALFDSAARFTDRLPAAGVLQFCEYILEQQIPGESRRNATPMAAAQLMTAHASKGLEWDVVCVLGVQEGTWPDLRRRGSLLGTERLVDVLAGRARVPATLAPQLAEERRLFYVAVTRARSRLVVTAVSGEDEQPSRFLDELDPVDGVRELSRVPTGVHLSGLVAELRAVACDPSADPADRAAAAEQLARLARAGVRGAHPDQWWGLVELSNPGPVVAPAEPVAVSPSRIEAFLRCELRALLEQLGARDADPSAASLGSLIHEVAAIATAAVDDGLPDLALVERLLDERWHTLPFEAAWYAANEKARARAMLAKLVRWLVTTRGELTLVSVEEEFDVAVGEARLRGRVDRLERDPTGRLVVVDLKTGKSKPAGADLLTNAQLGAYQLAVEAGGFRETGDTTAGSRGKTTGEAGDTTAGVPPPPPQSGGARLVQLGANRDVADQRQPPLADMDDPGWIAERIGYVAQRMHGADFLAAANAQCGACGVRSCCPLVDDGAQVTT